MVVSVLDFDKICRTCMKSNGKLRSIFDINKKQTTKLSIMITECVSVKVTENDSLPSKICTKCVYKLNNLCRFRKKCQDVDLKLRTYSQKVIERHADETSTYDADTYDNRGSYERDTSPSRFETAVPESLDLGSNIDDRRCVESTDRSNRGDRDLADLRSKNDVRDGIVSNDDPVVRREIESNAKETFTYGPIEGDRSTDPGVARDVSDDGRDDSRRSKTGEDVGGSIDSVDSLETRRTRPGDETSEGGADIVDDGPVVEKRPAENKKKHQCETCGKFLSCRSNLLQHMRRHTGEKPFPCDLCGKSFGRAEHMAIHRRTHTGERPHVCKVCGKAFVQHAALASHVRTHTGERPHVCSACGKSFAQAVTLTYHVRTHTGETPFECELCGKGFAHSGNLNIHMRFHNGERPFCCSTCGRRFVTSSHLAVHVKQHDGIRDHACAVCGKAFVRREHLRDHAVIHTGAKPHACKLCPKKYTQSSHLSRHMKTHAKREAEAVFLKTESVD